MDYPKIDKAAAKRRVSKALLRYDGSGLELARKLGVHCHTLYNWEGEHALPQYRFLYRIAEVCHVSYVWLLYGEIGDPWEEAEEC